MTNLLRAGRTAVVALALVAVEVGFAAQVGAQVPPVQSSSSSTSTSSATPAPTPTPCPTDLTGVLCTATSSSTPAPTPSPTPTPTAAPQQSSGTGGGSGGSGTTTTGSKPPTTSGSNPGGGGAAQPAGPKPSAQTVAEVAATFRNAPFLGQLLDILNHPTSDQRPDLHHFRPAGGAAAVNGRGGPGGSAGGVLGLVSGIPAARSSLGAAVAIALLGLLLAVGIAVLVGYPEARLGLRRLAAAAWRMHPSLHRVFVTAHNLATRVQPALRRARTRLGVPRFGLRPHSHRTLAGASALAALPGLLIAAIVGNAALAGPAASLASARPAPTSSYLRGEMSLSASEALQVGNVEETVSWTHLVTIERGLAAQQDELAAQEGQIDRLVINLAGNDPDSEDGLTVGPNSPAQQRNTLATLVAAHAATQAAYEQSLQAEYDLYRAAAENPAQRAQLTAAVATQQPQVQQAVSYNLSLIQTQLAQEATIAAAEAKLQSIGSLTSAQLAAMRGHQPFIAPLVAPVSQPFGPTDFSLEPPLSFNGTFYPHFHTGLDLAAPLDTPVHAAADGVVLLAAASVDQNGKLVGYGNYVVVAHPDGFVTLYGHLDSIAVKAGQVVHQGDIVGLEGSTGWSTGPHVHFEIRHDGQFLDPAPYLKGQLPS